MAVAQNTTYRGKQVLIGRMSDLTGRTASKAFDISPFVTNLQITDTPQKETVELIANDGQQSSDVTGTRKFNGTLDLNLPTELVILMISGVIGKDTQVATVAPTWAATTAVVAGEIYQLTGGEYIVAQNDGTTGATEPTAVGDYELVPALPVQDGDVTWRQRDTHYTSTAHNSGFCTDKYFLIERVQEGCGSANVFDTIMEDVELSYFTIEKADGQVISKQSIPIMATKSRRSSELDYEDITVTSPISIPDRVFTQNDCTIRVNAEQYGTLHNFSLPYTRNITMVDDTEPNKQIVKVDAPTLTGEAVLELDPAEYNLLLEQDVKALSVVMDHKDGEVITFTYATTTFDEPSIQTNGNEPRLLTAMMKPTGNKDQPMCVVEVQTGTSYSV